MPPAFPAADGLIYSPPFAVSATPETIMVSITNDVHVIIIVYSATFVFFAIGIAFVIASTPSIYNFPHVITIRFFIHSISPLRFYKL